MENRYPFELKFHHVGVFVTNINRSIQWYEYMLGFKLMFRKVFNLPEIGPTEMAWLKHGDYYIELYDLPKAIPCTHERYWGIVGTKHLCLYVKNEEFQPLISHLESKNAKFVVRHRWPEEMLGKPGGCGVIYITDPDDIRVEIQEEFIPGEY